jgi:hypothetical protein
MNNLKSISEEEREHLLSEIHRFLIWVGEPLPDIVEINGDAIRLHDIIWNCIHKKEISEYEKGQLMDLVHSLETKERYDEEKLKSANITNEEAKILYHEIASTIRAIMDLKDCGAGKFRSVEAKGEMKQKVEDTKRWLGFLKNIGKTH